MSPICTERKGGTYSGPFRSRDCEAAAARGPITPIRHAQPARQPSPFSYATRHRSPTTNSTCVVSNNIQPVKTKAWTPITLGAGGVS